MTDQKLCDGCVNDFYNGKNPYGIADCWHRKDATMVKRIAIPIDMAPPYKGMAVKDVPSCYRKQRYAMTDPKELTTEGYWK